MDINKIHKAYDDSLGLYSRDVRFLFNLYGKPAKYLPHLGNIDKSICPVIDSRYTSTDDGFAWKIVEGSVDYNKTIINLLSNYPNTMIFNPDGEINFILHEDWAFDISECECYVYSDVIPKAFIDCIYIQTTEATIGYITSFGQNGARISKRTIKQVVNSEILDNYNDDLPNDEIIKFLKSKESGLIVLRGLPGTGKTTLVRSWINLIRDKSFVTMDVSDFSALVSNKQCLADLENRILILEDCEDLLKDRNRSSFAYGMSTLLNITDGIFGDFLNLKIICTFNANLNDVDKALLRKGRIKIMYEFKELDKDKADNLRAKLGKTGGKSNILCDIFNEDSVGVKDQVKTTKIGF